MFVFVQVVVHGRTVLWNLSAALDEHVSCLVSVSLVRYGSRRTSLEAPFAWKRRQYNKHGGMCVCVQVASLFTLGDMTHCMYRSLERWVDRSIVREERQQSDLFVVSPSLWT